MLQYTQLRELGVVEIANFNSFFVNFHSIVFIGSHNLQLSYDSAACTVHDSPPVAALNTSGLNNVHSYAYALK